MFSLKRRVAIAYRITDHAIEILRVFYGGRDFEVLMRSD